MALQGDIQYRLKIFLRWQEALERIASKEGARLESWPGSLQPGSERRYSLNTPRPLASSLDEYSGNFGCSAAMARLLSLVGQRHGYSNSSGAGRAGWITPTFRVMIQALHPNQGHGYRCPVLTL